MTNQNSRQLAKTWPHPRHGAFKNRLCVAAEQWFLARGYEVQHGRGYCLARHDLWPKNIIYPRVVDYINSEREAKGGKDSYPLHNALHHGLSSQAMAFNLIGPLIVKHDLAPLREALETVGIVWPRGAVDASFEYSNRSIFAEDSGQPTSIDIALAGSDSRIFIEAKLVEPDFGGCSVFRGGDCEGRNPYPGNLGNCYLHHIGRKYWDLLVKSELAEASLFSGAICPFANYYQFFREALFAFAEGGVFVLLHDERNPAFLKSTSYGAFRGGLWPFLCESLPDGMRRRVAALTVQSLVQAIADSGRHEDWIDDFRAKYGLQ